MPTRYKNIFLAALVIAFGFGMSELSKFLTTTFNINYTVSFLITLVLGLVIIYVVAKKLRLGEEDNTSPEDKP